MDLDRDDIRAGFQQAEMFVDIDREEHLFLYPVHVVGRQRIRRDRPGG